MRTAELALLYALVGVGAAIAASLGRAPLARRAGDAVLLALLWPLYGPFLLAQQAAPSTPSTGDGRVDPMFGAFLGALRRARSTPLGRLLPDEHTATRLAERLAAASSRVREIDALLARPDFAEPAAERRLVELEANRASETAIATAQSRLANLRRLRALRDRSARELDEVAELLAQLQTQAEVVRLAGDGDGAIADVVRELVARVEGLDAVLDGPTA